MRIEFSPPPGINNVDTKLTASGRYVDCVNVRFYKGKPQVIGGYVRQFGTSFINPPSNLTPDSSLYVKAMIAYTNSDRDPRIVMGSRDKLFFCNPSTGTITDRTPASPETKLGWQFAMWGDDVMAAQFAGKLYTASGAGSTGATFTLISQAPTGILSMVVTAERQVLVATRVTIYGSEIEDYTDWTPTTSNNAFSHVLDGEEGSIVTMRVVGPYVAVWTTTSLYLGQFIGDPGQTYRFDRVATNCGLFGPRSVAITDKGAYWLSKDRTFRFWAPGGGVDQIPCPILKEFQAGLSPGAFVTNPNDVIATPIGEFGEVWFFYGTSTSGLSVIDDYVAFSTEDLSWFKGAWPYNLGDIIDSHLLRGLSGYSSVLATGDSKIFSHDYGTSTPSGESAFSFSLTSAPQYIEEGEREFMVRDVRPDFKDQSGNVSLTFTMRKYPNPLVTTSANQATSGPHTITTTTLKKDFRLTGRLISLAQSGTANYGMRFGTHSFDAVPLGKGR